MSVTIALTRPTLEYTTLDDIPKIHARLRVGFDSRKSRPVAYRKQQIAQLGYMLQDNAERFEAAFKIDFGRHPNDSHLCELGSCHAMIVHALKNVDDWARTKRAPFDINWFAFSPKVRQEPRGLVMIISPFNYPLYLSIPAMATAIAAGNAVVLKPSESTPATSTLLAELFPKYLDRDLFALVNGSIAETQKLLDLRWDHIFFTGSAKVGKVVALAAAKHLTPVTLELGGKSPVIIDGSEHGSNFELAARRILWGKILNAGQTCVSPDYVLVPRHWQAEFVAEMRKAHEEMFPLAEGGARYSTSYSRIVNEAQFDRLKKVLDTTKGTIVLGGDTDRDDRYIAPTLVKDCKGDDSLMQEEIFGPILPIVPVDDVHEAIAFVNGRDTPLALMVFSKDEAFKQYVFDHTQSGGCLANECLLHAACYVAPFGGVGQSGYGQNLGVHGFKTFSHARVVVDSPSWLDSKFLFGARYPPYKDSDLSTIKWLWGEGTIPHPRAGSVAPVAEVASTKTSWTKVGVALGLITLLGLQCRQLVAPKAW